MFVLLFLAFPSACHSGAEGRRRKGEEGQRRLVFNFSDGWQQAPAAKRKAGPVRSWKRRDWTEQLCQPAFACFGEASTTLGNETRIRKGGREGEIPAHHDAIGTQ
ncbi:hypothetical protein C7974DRAFT_190391 [Boeremia exigua]|uniref:uncharacterized protein n=1 Tax=Boeremia exigua TaxID=749465 RepID=UPI001E8E2BF2|nr:uncharacterized protein C7974DRAFT_190391 [Boeremia exigua]KAH6629636.1 hypothetical protein C7974DRAFT_190391 [Boeremia exigua]